jgi:hypothetical protein
MAAIRYEARAQPASPTAVRWDARIFSVYVELRGKLDGLE